MTWKSLGGPEGVFRRQNGGRIPGRAKDDRVLERGNHRAYDRRNDDVNLDEVERIGI